MTVYSYNAKQLSKKVAPKIPYWTKKKVAITSSLGLLSLFGALVATAPSVPDVAVEVQAPVTQEKPKTLVVSVASQTPVAEVALQTYQCEIDGTFYEVANKAACDKKIADTWKNFDPNAFANEYKDALDAVAEKTKLRK